MTSPNTQLSYPQSINLDKIKFSVPVQGQIPNTSISYHRIPFAYENDNGTTGDLVLCTSKIFSFGVKESTDPTTKKGTGNYNLPLCMFNKAGASEEERKFVEIYDTIIEKAKEELLRLKKDDQFALNGYRINEDNLEDFVTASIYKGQRTNGVPNDPDFKPILNAKLMSKNIYNKETGQSTKQILTKFYNEEGDELNYEDCIGKYMNTTSAIKIEGIFINKKTISMQVKVLETEIEFIDQGVKSLLKNRQEPKENEDSDSSSDSESSDSE